jgi:hypothetical protein
MDATQLILSVVLLLDGDRWVAQCLDFDIAAQGQSIKEAQESFERVFFGQIALDLEHGRSPLAGIERAPDEYWDLFKAARFTHSFPLKSPLSNPAGAPRARAEARVAA